MARSPSRGFALVSVLVVMGGAILLATALLFVAQAQVAGSAHAEARVQARALAWSGALVAVTRLDAQRDVILQGRTPALDRQFVIYEGADQLAVARLLPIGPGGADLVPEAGKLDLDHADAAMLAGTGLVDEALAGAIVDHRTALGRPYQSVAELLDVPGMSPATLLGAIDELAEPDTRSESDVARGLADVVTVYGFEPALQLDGKRRINLNQPWSEQMAARLARRFGDEAAETLGQVLQSGTEFDTEAKIFQVLRFFEVPPEQWPPIIDAFTTDTGEFHFGRLDINTAPYEALAALPGLQPQQAAQIVQARDDLSADDRSTVVWLITEGIVEPEAIDRLAGRITTRCWTYRIRLAAGLVDAAEPDGPLSDPVIYEAVIDLSAPKAQVAYLRDVTWLGLTASVALQSDTVAPEPEPESLPPEQPDTALPVNPDEFPAPTPRRRIGRWLAG